MEDQNKDVNLNEQNNETNETPTEGTVFNQKDSKAGPLVGSIIVIILILVGGVYFWGSVVEEKKNEIEQQEPQPALEEDLDSDPLEEIEKINSELDTFNIDEINQELEQIDAEFENL